MITIKGKIPFSIIPIKDNEKIELDSNLKIIGNILNLTEDQCCELVNTIFIEIPPSPSNDMGGDWDIGYVDYLNVGEYAGWQGDAGVFRHAKESLRSLLISENIWIKKWVYIPYDESCKDKRGLHLEFPGGEEYLNLPDDLILVKQTNTEEFNASDVIHNNMIDGKLDVVGALTKIFDEECDKAVKGNL